MTTITAAMRTTLTFSSSFSPVWLSPSSSPPSSCLSLPPSLSTVDRESSLTPPRRSLLSASQRSLHIFFRVFYRRFPVVFCILVFEKSDVWATESHHIPSHPLLSLSPCCTLCDCVHACVCRRVCLYRNHSKGEHWRSTNPEAKKHFFLLDLFRGLLSQRAQWSPLSSHLLGSRAETIRRLSMVYGLHSLFLSFSSLCFFVVFVSASAIPFRGGSCVRDIQNEMT